MAGPLQGMQRIITCQLLPPLDLVRVCDSSASHLRSAWKQDDRGPGATGSDSCRPKSPILSRPSFSTERWVSRITSNRSLDGIQTECKASPFRPSLFLISVLYYLLMLLIQPLQARHHQHHEACLPLLREARGEAKWLRLFPQNSLASPLNLPSSCPREARQLILEGEAHTPLQIGVGPGIDS